MEDHSLTGFCDWLRRRGRSRSETAYRGVVARYVENPKAVLGKVVDRAYSPNYRRHLAKCVRAWARYKRDHDLLDELEEIRLPAPMPKSAREPLSIEDWFGVLDAIDKVEEPLRAVLGLITVRGIRCGDVLRLRKSDLSRALKAGVLSFESKGERRVEFSVKPLRTYVKALVAWRWPEGKDGQVWQLVSRSPESAGRRVRRAFDKLAKDLDLEPEDLYAHRFRHTYATHFLQKMQGDPEAVFKLQQQMGWAQVGTAANYLRRSRRKELDATEDELFSRRDS